MIDYAKENRDWICWRMDHKVLFWCVGLEQENKINIAIMYHASISEWTLKNFDNKIWKR